MTKGDSTDLHVSSASLRGRSSDALKVVRTPMYSGVKESMAYARIIGEIICIRRGVSRIKDAHNPSGVLSHLRHLDSLAQRLVDIFSDLPSPLRLEIASSPVNFDMWVISVHPSINTLAL